MRKTPRVQNRVMQSLALLCLALALGWSDWRSSVGAQSPSGVGYEPPKCGCQDADVQGRSAISLSEGNLSDDYEVVSVRSAFGATIELTLFYSSANADGSRMAADLGLGLGWSHSYLTMLYEQTAQPGTLFRFDATGRTTRYTPNGDGTFSPNTGYFERIHTNGDGSYSLRQKDGFQWTFAEVAGPPLPPPFDTGAAYRLIRTTDRVGNVTTMSYTDGLLPSVTDTYGRQLELAYDGARRLLRITDPLSRSTTLGYDVDGNLQSILDPEGHTRTHTYNAAHQLTEKIARDGRTYRYRYSAGKPVAIEDEDGVALFALSNPNNWATDPDALATNLSREYIPGTTTHTDGNGDNWQHNYDVNGYISVTSAPDNATTRSEYDAVTLQLAAFTDANNHTSAYSYDAQGNRVRVVDPLGYETTYTYEPTFNQVTSVTDANGRTTVSVYDAVGNRVRETDALGGVRQWTYDLHGNLLSATDQRGNRTRYQYDGFGQRVKMIDPFGRVTSYTYDAVGNLLTETDPNLHTTTYAYDAVDRRVRDTNPLGNVEETHFDGEGHVTSIVDRNLHTTQFEYDSRGRRILTIDPALQTTTTEYDGNDNVITETDPGGHTTRYTYDVHNRLITTTDALLQTMSRSYDDVGNLASQTDANGHTTSYTYDALNRRRTRTDAENALTEWRYDAVGSCSGCTGPTRGSNFVTQQLDAVGKITFFKYDGLDRLVRDIRKEGDVADVEDSSDAVTRYAYDAASNQIAVTDPVGQTTAMVYDRLNRLALEQNAVGEVTSYSYDNAGNLRRVITPNRNTTSYTYDAADRVTRITDSGGLARVLTYDPQGNLLTDTNGVAAVTHFAYDVLDRLIARTDPLGQVTTHAYDPDGSLTELVDREGRREAYTYDVLHRRTLFHEEGAPSKPALIRDTAYAYDSVGNVTSIVDANGQATHYTYDAVDRRITETYPDDPPNVRSFTYDPVGNVTGRTDQAGRTTSYVYNDLHFLVTRDYSTGDDDVLTYDPAGRVLTATRGAWHVAFFYDGANRVIETIQNGQRVRRGYDIAGRTRQLVYPGGRVVTEVLDARDRKTSVLENGATLVSYTHDKADRATTRRYANGVTRTFTYDKNDRVKRLLDRTSTATLLQFEYGYDREGNRLFERQAYAPKLSEAYRHDGVHRLVERKVGVLNTTTVPPTVPLPITQTAYDLDLLGNWDQKTTNSVVETRAHNDANEITAIDATVVLHDDTGNLTNDGTRGYEYDEENRLVRVTRLVDGEVLGEYQYDALGRRVRKFEPQTFAETAYYYDGWRVIEEQDAAGSSRATYLYGDYIDEVLAMDRGGQRLFYHHDTLYSVTALSSASGVLIEGYRYDAYGRQTVYTPGANGVVTFGGDDQIFVGGVSSLGNPYTFTGRELDRETGLLHYRARVYDPDLGRFLSRDPIAYESDSLNLYEYVNSAPTRWVDPSGLDEKETVPLKDFWDKWKKDHPGFNPADYAKIFDTIDRGCVGITCAALGEPGMPDMSNCFATFEQVSKREREMVKKDECCKKGKKNAYGQPGKPRIFSIRFWSKGQAYAPDPKTGKVDMGGWTREPRPGHTNFDYGLYDKTTGRWTHANHCEPGMKVYVSDLEGYSRKLADFDKQVFCVACEDWRLTGYGKKEDDKKGGKKKPAKKTVAIGGIR